MEPYTLDTLQTSLQIVDYKMAMEIASKILIWEMMHRFTFCIIEVSLVFDFITFYHRNTV